MNQEDMIIEKEVLTYETCLKEVPQSEVEIPEAADYVTYYCGLECYDLWRRQGERQAALKV